MQIDWLTVAAQIVNFLVLVWLLNRFLYRPITAAMRQREARIATRLAEAQAARTAAEAEARRLQDREAEIEAQRVAILAEARTQAEALRRRLEAEVRAAIDDRRAAWLAHLAAERAALVAALQRQAGQQVLDITRRVLAEFTDSDLSDRLVTRFAARLGGLGPDIRDRLAHAAAGQGATALIETGAPLDAAAKARITRAVHEVLSADLPVDHRADPDIGLGVRLTLGDQRIEWSAAHHLDRVRTELGEILDAGLRAMAPAPAAAPDGGGAA